jgi:hypothetical protein
MRTAALGRKQSPLTTPVFAVLFTLFLALALSVLLRPLVASNTPGATEPSCGPGKSVQKDTHLNSSLYFTTLWKRSAPSSRATKLCLDDSDAPESTSLRTNPSRGMFRRNRAQRSVPGRPEIFQQTQQIRRKGHCVGRLCCPQFRTTFNSPPQALRTAQVAEPYSMRLRDRKRLFRSPGERLAFCLGHQLHNAHGMIVRLRHLHGHEPDTPFSPCQEYRRDPQQLIRLTFRRKCTCLFQMHLFWIEQERKRRTTWGEDFRQPESCLAGPKT